MSSVKTPLRSLSSRGEAQQRGHRPGTTKRLAFSAAVLIASASHETDERAARWFAIYDLRTRPTASFAQNRASHAFASSPSLPHASPHSTDHPGAKTASDKPASALADTESERIHPPALEAR